MSRRRNRSSPHAPSRNSDPAEDAPETKPASDPPESAVQTAEEDRAEAEAGAASAVDIPAVAEDTFYDGPLLKQIREARGLALKEVFERTRIGVPTLAAVEEERFADLPGARIYIRGFVRCLAEEIGLDPDAVEKSYVPRWERWFDEQKAKQKPYLR